MSEKYISVVGLRHYFGSEIFHVDQMVTLKKDYENTHDDEAIAVHIESVGKVGYVANSTYMVARGTRSAGRIYDSFDEEIAGEVCFVVRDCVIVKIVVE